MRGFLTPYAGSSVEAGPFRAGQRFPIDELIADIDLLLEHGHATLQPWWDGADHLDLRSPEGRLLLSDLLDLHYRRTQFAYRELCENSFPLIAEKFPFYQVIPIRYEIEVEIRGLKDFESASLHWKWVPVREYEEAGAAVSFPQEVSDMNTGDAVTRHFERIDSALTLFGRVAPDRAYTWGSSRLLPDFFGRDPTRGGNIDETSVVRSAAKHVQQDLKSLFRELPSSDSGAVIPDVSLL